MLQSQMLLKSYGASDQHLTPGPCIDAVMALLMPKLQQQIQQLPSDTEWQALKQLCQEELQPAYLTYIDHKKNAMPPAPQQVKQQLNLQGNLTTSITSEALTPALSRQFTSLEQPFYYEQANLGAAWFTPQGWQPPNA